MSECRWQNIEEAIVELIALGSSADDAERTFIERCMELEASELWQQAKTPKDVDFSAFLSRCGIPGADRYTRCASALRADDTRKVAVNLGMDAAVVFNEIADPEVRGKAIESGMAASANRKRQGQSAKLPERTARQIRTEVAGPKVRVSQEDALRAEVHDLEKKLAERDRKIAKLESQVEDLRERLSAAESAHTENRAHAKRARAPKDHRSQPRV